MRLWHRPIPLSRLRSVDIPDRPGVYVLLSDARDMRSVVKIAPARSLARSFRIESESNDPHAPVKPDALMYFETVYEAEEAERMLNEYKRNTGRRPILNSPF